MIEQESIDTIRDVDIVDVIGSIIDLKKEGANYKALSPFSNEKTPSFVVSPVKQIWKDYSTGVGGDAIEFVKQHEKLDFIETIRYIASQQSIVLKESKKKLTEADKRTIDKLTEMKAVNSFVATTYQKELMKLNYSQYPDKGNWPLNDILDKRGMTADTIINYAIGYAPKEFKTITSKLIASALVSPAKDLGLIKTKNNNSYDTYIDRIIFPIHDNQGNVVGFGGRKNSKDKKADSYPKYLNSAESLIYKKDQVLYGLYQGQKKIRQTNKAFLVEGYTDVTAMAQNGFENTVATCGTALTPGHTKLLRRYTNRVVLMRDGDEAGQRATMKDIRKLIKADFKVYVCVLPENHDPESYSRTNIDFTAFVEQKTQDAFVWFSKQMAINAANDKYEISIALKTVVETLNSFSDDTTRQLYIDDVKNHFSINKGEIKSMLKDISEKVNKTADIEDEETLNNLKLPDGADPKQFLQDRFAIVKNKYYFQTQSGGFFQGTNFSVNPLFHIKGTDNKRLCEIDNGMHNKIVDFPSSALINFNQFKEILISEGFFMFLAGSTPQHFSIVAQKLAANFQEAEELKTLGWQQESFWSYANGIYSNNKFNEVNDYGITMHTQHIGKADGSVVDKEKLFFSPAFSKIYADRREDDDPYENDRYFIYKKASVSFNNWSAKLIKVYGDDFGTIGTATVVASLFRDLYLKRWGSFPHIYLAGEKGSGKSMFAFSLTAPFAHKLEAFDLNAGTLVGFYRRLARMRNGLNFFDEYHDKIDDRMFQGLKGGFDGRGRETGKATQDNRTVTTKVNSGLVIAGQYFATRDDNSLTSRSMNFQFVKKEVFTNEEKEDYEELKKWEDEGLTSMITEILEHRKFIEANLTRKFNEIRIELKKRLGDREYQERMLNNFTTIVSPVALLENKIEFPFTVQELLTLATDKILENSDLITDSEGLSSFWNILEGLLHVGFMKEGYDFVIDTPLDFTFNPKKHEKEKYLNSNRNEILYLRLNLVHGKYADVATKRDGVEVIGESTMRNYFRSKKYFIGPVKGKRFKNGSGSCYAFNYTQMLDAEIVNFEMNETAGQAKHRENIEYNTPKVVDMHPQKTGTNNNDDDLPF